MVKEFLEQQVFMYVMLALCGIGIVAKLLLLMVYGRLVKASFHMPDTTSRLFKLMRLKFEACYKLKISVHNVGGFVDKYFLNYKFCGICLHTWHKFSRQMGFLCICVGAAAAILGGMEECSVQLILEHVGIGLLTAALLYTLDGLCAFDFKNNQMRVNAIDFFDNFLKSRLEAQYFHEEEAQDRQQAYRERELEEQSAVSGEAELAEQESAEETKKQEVRTEPAPARRRRKPEMFVPPEEEAAAGREERYTTKPEKSRTGRKAEEELLERSIEEVEKEKIIEDILKEYLV